MKLTVLLCVHNGMPYISKSVKSILNQSYKNFRFVIVNNASTDETKQFLKSINDARLVLIDLPKKGIIEAHNYGLSLIETKYTAIMDADDYSHPERLKTQLNFLETYPDIGLVGTSISYFGRSLTRKWDIRFPSENSEIVNNIMKGRYTLAHPTIMFRTKIAQSIGGYSLDSFPVPDLDFFLRFSTETGLANIPDIYHYFRISPDSFTQKNLKRIIITKNLLLKKNKKEKTECFITFKSYIEYLSVFLYKKGLLLYLNDSILKWIFFLIPASFISIPKAFHKIRNLILKHS